MTDSEKSAAGRVDLFESVRGETVIRIQTSLAGNHPHLALIGRVASEWTHFENILDEIIIHLLEIPEEIALCITRHIMGATPRFKMIESLGKLRGVDEEKFKKLRRLKSDQYETSEHRNRIVHDPWFDVQIGPNENAQTNQLKTRGLIPVSEKEINETIEAIKDLIRRAAELQVEIMLRRPA